MAHKDRELIVYNGEEAYQYPDGTIRGKHGEIITRTSESALAMRKAKLEKGTALAGEALKKVTKSETVDEGVQKLMEKHVEIAMTNKGRVGNDALRWLLDWAGYVENSRKVEVENNTTHREVYEIDPETREILEQLIQDRRDNHVTIEATLEDVDEN